MPRAWLAVAIATTTATRTLRIFLKSQSYWLALSPSAAEPQRSPAYSLAKLFLVGNSSSFWCGDYGCLARRRGCRIRGYPAIMDARCETVGCLRVDRSLLNDAAEHELQMLGRAVEPVIEVDVAARGVDIVAPKQAGDSSSGPNAFRRAGRPRQLCCRLSIFLHGLLGRFLRGLLGGLLIAVLLLWLLLALRLFRRLCSPPDCCADAGIEHMRKRPTAATAVADEMVQRSMELSLGWKSDISPTNPPKFSTDR